MSSWDEHCLECEKQLGKPFKEVHMFLDQWHSKFGGRHRFILHHAEGVEKVREKFGDEAVKAAELHIMMDCLHIPKSIKDYQTYKVDWLGYDNTSPPYTIIDKREET